MYLPCSPTLRLAASFLRRYWLNRLSRAKETWCPKRKIATWWVIQMDLREKKRMWNPLCASFPSLLFRISHLLHPHMSCPHNSCEKDDLCFFLVYFFRLFFLSTKSPRNFVGKKSSEWCQSKISISSKINFDLKSI